jgi:hypothetical protein
MKVSRNTLVVAVLTVLAVIAVKLALSAAPEEESPSGQEPAPVAAAPAPAPRETTPRPAQLSVPPMLAPVETPLERPEDEGEHGEFTTSTDIMKQQIFKKDPQLAQFDYFREHVLLDSATREDYRKLLADKAMIARTRDELIHPQITKVAMPTTVKRLMQIDYLREAMDWQQHPQRSELLGDVERIILEDSFTAEMPPDVKRALAATKLELFEILYKQDASRAQALVEKARGTRLEKMLAFFDEHNQRRLARERELSLQAQNTTTP